MKQKFDVTGMTCSACSAHVEKAVGRLDGIKDVSVSLLQNSMRVTYDDKVQTAQGIISAVEKAGYGARLQGAAVDGAAKPARLEEASMKRRLVLSVCFLAPLMYISMGHMAGAPLPGFLSGMQNAVSYGMAQFLLTLPILYVNRKYYENGFKSLFGGAPTMDSLIALGSMAAAIYGVYAILQMGVGLGVQDMALVERYHMDLYFESAGTILTLITVGKYLESRSKGKTGDAINKLMDLAPKTALVERGGREVEIPLEEVKVGDILIVKTGGGIPVDGMVAEGAAAVDEAALTGESLPVDKQAGDRVTGGTMCKSGWLKMRAEHVGADTTLARIIRLVEEASAGKAPIAKLADKVSAVFVPIVIAVATISTVAWLLAGQPLSFALSIGIAVLVISCPCALGLATPTAIMVGMGRGAQRGVLFKTAESLEEAHRVQVVVLDKTGTVTEGKPSVVGVYPAAGVSGAELLSLAAAIEKPSEHPLAQAIVRYAHESGVEIAPAGAFTQTPGRGVHATVSGAAVLGGNEKMMAESGVGVSALLQSTRDMAAQGRTPLYFARDGALLGVIALADTVKKTSRQAISALHDMGLETVLLTGDNEHTARAIAKKLGIGSVIAQVLPDEKEKHVRELQAGGRRVAMVGDGINDAPALMRADVGIAVGAGTDVAIDSADVVLMRNDLMDVPYALRLSAATLRNIKQNLFWAFFYNAVGIPLAAGVFYPALGWKLSPMFAAAAMSLSSLFVVTNALRLRFFKPKFSEKTPAGSEEEDMPIIVPDEPGSKGEGKMGKTILVTIEGMTCGHCTARVKKTLEALAGVDSADVDLESGVATLSVSGDVPNEEIRNAVGEDGYKVMSITVGM